MQNTGFSKTSYLNKEFLIISFMVINAFSWYFPLYVFFTNTFYSLEMKYEELLLIFGFHYFTVLLFAVISATLVNKILSRELLLSLWMLLGTLSSISIILLKFGEYVYLYLVSFLFGMSLGFGFPSCLAYFSHKVNIEHRGRASGITMFASFIGIFLLGFASNILDFKENVLVFTLWRGVGFIVFYVFKPKETKIKEVADVNYKSILSEKPFILYIIPWIMFSLVNFFGYPLQQHYLGIETSTMIATAEFGIGSVCALIGGYFSDVIGRKRLVIFGYVILGIAYAMLSILPTNQISIIIYAVFDGVAWGLFALIFFLVIWGDLAGNKPKDKYYLLGELPFLISSYISIIVAPYAKIISISISFSLASFFLFLAVLPLMYAPETLPEKVIRRRELKKYVEKAKKLREKYEKGED